MDTDFSDSPTLLKILVISIIILLLQIPIYFISSQVAERTDRSEGISSEENGLPQEQRIYSPVLAFHLPSVQAPEQYGTKWSSNSDFYSVPTPRPTPSSGMSGHENSVLYLSPSFMKVSGAIDVEERNRGIFTFSSFHSDVVVEADFDLESLTSSQGESWQEWPYELLVGMGDVSGMTAQATVACGEQVVDLNLRNGAGYVMVFQRDGVCGSIKKVKKLHLVINLPFRGEGSLSFLSSARNTQISLHSNWPSPSFGGVLPTERRVDEKGFSAEWSIPYFATDSVKIISSSGDGNLPDNIFNSGRMAAVTFHKGISDYRMVERSVKYQLLFFSLTFLALFLIEILLNCKVHPVQYLLIGAALTLFYLLLLSLSEHLNFGLAYLIASLGITGLIGGYSRAVLHLNKAVATVVGLVSALYLYLYTLLSLEEYALLSGSLGLFFILGAVMYTTRNINWYLIGAKKTSNLE